MSTVTNVTGREEIAFFQAVRVGIIKLTSSDNSNSKLNFEKETVKTPLKAKSS